MALNAELNRKKKTISENAARMARRRSEIKAEANRIEKEYKRLMGSAPQNAARQAQLRSNIRALRTTAARNAARQAQRRSTGEYNYEARRAANIQRQMNAHMRKLVAKLNIAAKKARNEYARRHPQFVRKFKKN